MYTVITIMSRPISRGDPFEIIESVDSKYRLDIESMGSTGFRNPRALGRSVPSVARALLRARGFLNLVDPIGRDV